MTWGPLAWVRRGLPPRHASQGNVDLLSRQLVDELHGRPHYPNHVRHHWLQDLPGIHVVLYRRIHLLRLYPTRGISLSLLSNSGHTDIRSSRVYL
jgi:hypothetical protein